MPDDTVATMMAADAVDSRDKLDRLVSVVTQYRSLEREILDLEERLEDKRQERQNLERTVLPDMFAAAGIDEISIPRDGNYPGAEAKLSNFYRANIPQSWDPPRREHAFSVLYSMGLGSLVKNVVTVTLSHDEGDRAKKIYEAAVSKGHDATLTRSVHWKSLTAAIQEMCEAGRRPAVAILDSVGATVGKIVRVKTR